MSFLIAIESGFLIHFPDWLHFSGLVFSLLFILAGIFEFVFYFFISPSKREFIRRKWWNFIFFILILLTLKNFELSRFLALAREIFFLLLLFSKRRSFQDFFAQPFVKKPTRLLAMSFITIIFIGTILLTFPVSSENHQRTGVIDALFTATSATCVTGLIVKDTPKYWSTFGEIVILLLIQAGGLGIMTFSISIALVFGAKLGLREKRALGEILEFPSVGEVGNIIKFILKFTFLAEFFGFILLFFRWLPLFGDAKKALYFSIFHSVSAFCNAGFSLFSTSLKRFVSDPVTNIVMMLLIISGGIGFVVISGLFKKEHFIKEWRLNSPKLTVHTKLVIIMSMVLIFIGFILFFVFEFDNVLIHQGIGSKLWASLFQSITSRTAGFNTVDTLQLKDVTLFMIIFLMFIGASPGSTGGGVKTSTFAVLILAVINMIRGREEIEIFNKTISKNFVYKAITIVIVSAFMISLGTGLLLITQKDSLMHLLFEVTSAFGTVGLSTGITPMLNGIGKIIIIILIYIGRIGPLTLAFAVGRYSKKLKREYPKARIMVG
ncbi:MAG: Trk family potassium uptake protein [Candidatus Cloacimonadota bacterium]|nr:MAG: Trk family potassium uptake protein [Candidatus Cloacimonadota bacterium]